MNFDEVEKMNISESGKLIGQCRIHLIDYMKQNKEPIRTPELLNALVNDAKRVGIPDFRGDCTKREAYMCALASEQQKRNIEVSLDYYLVWHEYIEEGRKYRGHVYD